jgi:hypothetical protein
MIRFSFLLRIQRMRFSEGTGGGLAMVSETSWQTAWMRSKNQPLLFVTDVLGAKPEPWQAEALEAVGRHDRVSIRSGHGVGKTTFESWLILWTTA